MAESRGVDPKERLEDRMAQDLRGKIDHRLAVTRWGTGSREDGARNAWCLCRRMAGARIRL